MAFFTGSNKDLDAVTDENLLVKVGGPEYAGRFDAIKETRSVYEDLATYTNHGRIVGGHHYKRMASIPAPLLALALEIEPDLLINKTKFYAWLARHPGYAITKNQGRRA